MNRLFESPKWKRKKTWNTPEKHRDKVHAVGYYPGHLKDAQTLWNSLDKVNITGNQVDSKLSYDMTKPAPLDAAEKAKALAAGLEVVGQYVVAKNK